MVPPAILCNLTVAGLPLSVAAEASFTSSVFDPAIPISLGMTQDNLGNSVGLWLGKEEIPYIYYAPPLRIISTIYR